jgi:hypothetical protein
MALMVDTTVMPAAIAGSCPCIMHHVVTTAAPTPADNIECSYLCGSGLGEGGGAQATRERHSSSAAAAAAAAAVAPGGSLAAAHTAHAPCVPC